MLSRIPLLLGTLGTLTLWTVESGACSPDLPADLSVSPRIPAGGYILGRTSSGLAPEDLTFTVGGAALAGETKSQDGLFAFVPEVSLVEGDSVLVTSDDESVWAQVQIGPREEGPTLSVLFRTTTQAAGTISSCNEGFCSDSPFAASDKSERLGEFKPTLTQASQFYWTIEFRAGTVEGTVSGTLAHEWDYYPIGASSDEVCVKASWVHPIDGSTGELPELCESTAKLGLGVIDVPYREGNIKYCETPPFGYEAEWCSTQADAWQCETAPATGYCSNYARYCATGGTGGTGTGTDGEATDGSTRQRYAGFRCNLDGGPKGGSSTTFVALALLGLGALRTFRAKKMFGG